MTHTGTKAIVEPGGKVRLVIYGPLIDDFVILDLPHAVEALVSLQQAIREIQAQAQAERQDGG